MEDIVFVRRTKGMAGCRTYHKPVIKLELKGSRFIISKPLAKVLNVDEGKGVMFGFNKKEQTGYIIKDEEPDAFYLGKGDEFTFRFTSKYLAEFFTATFNLLETGKSIFYFNVCEKPNKKGLHKFTYEY